MLREDEALDRLIFDYPSLQQWHENGAVRSPPKVLNKDRTESAFEVTKLISLFRNVKPITDRKIKILFAHFSPFEWEMEALGLPIFSSVALPNAIIDLTYDKGGAKAISFRTDGRLVYRTAAAESEYDIIIARSSVLKNMLARPHDTSCIQNSGYVVNVKTMSYSPNYQHANYYFDEEEMCPPPNPVYLSRVENFLRNNKKENLIAVSGTLWHVKNQLKMFEQIDPSVVEGYRFVILGPTRDRDYVDKIIRECERKSLDYYLIGSVARSMAGDIKTLSKISMIPMDMRVFGQPKGYPRTLGESVGSKCLTLCNSPVTIPRFYKNTCRVYEESVPNDLNEKLQACIEEVSSPEFVKKHNWGEQSFEDVCESTIVKCLKLAGLYE